MLFMTIWDDILLAIVKALRSLFMSLSDVVYRLIVVFYDIFEKIGTATLLSNDTVMEMYRKVGLILGLFMVFKVSFSIINYIINPDLISDKQKGMGNIVKRIVIVVFLLGITPSLFREAYVLQNMLIKENIVGKILFEDNGAIDSSNGQNLAWFGFNSFYYLNKDEWTSGTSLEDKGNIKVGDAISKNTLYYLCPEMDDKDGSPTLVETTFKKGRTFKFAYNCLNETLEVEKEGYKEQLWVINFDGWGLICFAVGVLLLWMILMYTVQLGVRLLQLAYLQLIAPVPIIMYLDPKSEALTKWSKQCITTFLDYFIRTGIMYFAIFIINLLINNDTSFLDSFSGASKLYVKVIMIIAILIFAKRVPKLLEEIIPMLKNAASLDFGLKMPKEMKQVGGAIAGATVGGAVGLIGGGPKGLVGGVVKGGVDGFKSKKVKDIASARASTNLKKRQIREDENTTFAGRAGAQLRNTFGFESKSQVFDKQILEIDDSKIFEQKRKNDAIIAANKAISEEAEKELLKETNTTAISVTLRQQRDAISAAIEAFNNGTGTAADIETARNRYNSNLKIQKEAWINNSLTTNDNEVVNRNRQIIRNNSGVTIVNATDLDSQNSLAKNGNASIASRVANLEHEKEVLNKQKKVAQSDENAIKK